MGAPCETCGGSGFIGERTGGTVVQDVDSSRPGGKTNTTVGQKFTPTGPCPDCVGRFAKYSKSPESKILGEDAKGRKISRTNKLEFGTYVDPQARKVPKETVSSADGGPISKEKGVDAADYVESVSDEEFRRSL